VPVLNRTADAFQRALEGEEPREQLVPLVATGRRLAELGAGPSPDPAFVGALRARLMREAQTMPARSPARTRTQPAERAPSGPPPLVVVVGHGLPRALAGAAASVLLVGAIVGVVSRSAVPGDDLYPVKSWLDSVAVQLAGSDFDRGQTYLAQAQEHISDARDLTDQPTQPGVGEVNLALRQAIDSVRNGQRSLDRAYAENGNPQALIAMRDFTARALPQVEALRTQVRAGSLPVLSQLEALLQDTQAATARRLAACGAQCSALGSTTSYHPSALPSVSTTVQAAQGQSSVPAPSIVSRPSAGAISVPVAPLTNQAGSGGSVAAPSPGGVSVGGPTGGATLSTAGVGVRLPSLTASLPGTTSTAKLPLPSASLSTSGVGVVVPSATVGPATVPGVTISLP
jgi:hypothetical protein